MENMEKICNAAGSFLTYDLHQGLWSVVINKSASSVKSFDNSNIIGAIQVNGTSLTNLYNSILVEFPLRDTADQTDYVEISIPAGDRNANEPDNQLKITLDLCNEPVQAEIIGLIELKQSRLDQIITFQSDYSTLNLNAGDVIDVTNSLYQYTNKPFRVISLREIDDDAGSIRIEITALEYDGNVYDTSDLGRYIRTDRNGIKTIGAIGTPNEPQIYVYQVDRRPTIIVDAVVPGGIVESMELWLSTNGTDYTLVDTVYPVGGGTYTAGDAVVFDYDQVDANNYFVKVRGMNSTTTGPFSPVDSYIGYVPVPVSGAIDENTSLIDGGINIPLALGLSFLLSKLTSLFGSGDAGKSLIDQLVGGGMDLSQGATLSVASGTFTTNLNNSTAGYTTANGYVLANVIANTTKVTFTTTTTYKILEVTVQSPAMIWDYEFLDQAGTQRTAVGIAAQPPLGIELITGTPASPGTVLDSATLDWQSNTTTFNLTNVPAGNYFVSAAAFPTYALNMYWPRSLAANQWGQIYPINYSNPDSNAFRIFVKGVE
jgi:hypothetical protein